MSTMRKCQVVMLPTKEKAPLYLGFGGTLYTKPMNVKNSDIYQNLYFLSYEEIKEGDWYLNGNHLYQADRHYEKANNDRKIIATTDSSLEIINSKYDKSLHDTYLPQPSQEFLEVFVKEYNKSNIIKEVMVEYEEYHGFNTSLTEISSFNQNPKDYGKDYKIKINSKDNTITIKKIKDSWNREDHIYDLELLYRDMKVAREFNKFFTFEEWIKQNL